MILEQRIKFDKLFDLFFGKCKMLRYVFFEFFACDGIWHVKQRAGGRQHQVFDVQFLQQVKRFLVIVAPDVFPVDDAGKQDFSVIKASFDKFERFPAFDKIKPDSVKRKFQQNVISIANVTEICLCQNFEPAFLQKQRLIKRLEQSQLPFVKIFDQRRLVKLNPICAKIFKLLENPGICFDERTDKIFFDAAVKFAQLKQSERSDQNGTRNRSVFFCFDEFIKNFRSCQFDVRIRRKLRHDIMIVRVEPLLHRPGLDVALFALISSCQGKIFVQVGQIKFSDVFRNHVEQKGRIEHLIIKRKMVARKIRQTAVQKQLAIMLPEIFCPFF